MKKRFKTFLGFFALVLAVSFVKSTFAATVLNGNYNYNLYYNKKNKKFNEQNI